MLISASTFRYASALYLAILSIWITHHSGSARDSGYHNPNLSQVGRGQISEPGLFTDPSVDGNETGSIRESVLPLKTKGTPDVGWIKTRHLWPRVCYILEAQKGIRMFGKRIAGVNASLVITGTAHHFGNAGTHGNCHM